ncbi:MAG: alpha/beta fold hydrolase [Pseudomonadota bacterium]
MLSHVFEQPDGEAPIVLYLHGLAVGGWCWAPVRALLPENAALIPDLPGHEGSAAIPWRSLADTATRVAEVVDTLPPARPVHVTGHSLGGYVGLILLTLRPDRFASAMLSGFHVGKPPVPALLKLAYLANGLIFRAPPLLRRFVGVFDDPATARRFLAGAKVMDARTMYRAGSQVVDFVPPEGLDSLTLPILAVAAADEPAAIRRMPDRLARQHANIRGLVLDGRNHFWPINEPALYAGTLRGHIARSK